MNSNKRTARLGVLLAGSAAALAFGMTAPAMAAPTGGANGGGIYSTPTVGLTGNGNAPAKDAGSQGNADTKTPPGQVDNTHSNGYECGNNAGVGQMNVAHTGCDAGDGTPSLAVNS
jgi:hypothetical protein